MEIKNYADCPNHIKTATEWIYNEFIKDIRFGISYQQLSEMMSQSNVTSLPVRLIAVIDDVCIGTASLVKNDHSFLEYTPWLSALYVDPTYRGQKVAAKLIERVKEISKELGYKELYLRTEFASEYYRKRGWTFVESKLDEHNLVPDVFKCAL